MNRNGGILLEEAGADAPLAASRAAAERAAERAGVRIVTPLDLDDLRHAAQVWRRNWSPDGEPPVSADILRALTHAGNYLSVAGIGGSITGALLGFFGTADSRVDRMHSHILGVDPAMHGRGVGFALKLHQRAWALQRGIDRINWTYDPLVRRNGHFNLVKLGARGVEYLVDFYGPMPDAINGGDHSDRVLVEWDLTATATAGDGVSHPENVEEWLGRGAQIALGVDDNGGPQRRRVDTSAGPLLCATPPDIVELRRTDLAVAHRWRVAVRDTIVEAMAHDMQLVSMARGGWYVLSRENGATRLGG
jgi:predicted GNAT superfamily acetyltransferase